MSQAAGVFLTIAATPFIYYLIAIFSAWRYFRRLASAPEASFMPPVSILKPIRGLDPDAYENLASFCRQDYPEFEIAFCVDANDEAVRSVLAKLIADFPEHKIRVLYGSGRVATNDKVAKLAVWRLARLMKWSSSAIAMCVFAPIICGE
jgi:ceramide glucosyltransferase